MAAHESAIALDREDSVGIAQFYGRLGRYDLALLGVRAGVEKGYFCVSQLDRAPAFDPIRSDPGFQQTLALAAGAPPARRGAVC